MLPLALGLGMAALGAYKGKKQADRQAEIEADSRRQHAAQVRYSPWTGRQSFSPIQYASTGATDAMIGGGLQSGMTGAALGQGLASAGQPAAQQSPWEMMKAEEEKKKQLMMGQQFNLYSNTPPTV